jgi:hypothetical protein
MLFLVDFYDCPSQDILQGWLGNHRPYPELGPIHGEPGQRYGINKLNLIEPKNVFLMG